MWLFLCFSPPLFSPLHFFFFFFKIHSLHFCQTQTGRFLRKMGKLYLSSNNFATYTVVSILFDSFSYNRFLECQATCNNFHSLKSYLTVSYKWRGRLQQIFLIANATYCKASAHTNLMYYLYYILVHIWLRIWKETPPGSNPEQKPKLSALHFPQEKLFCVRWP